MNLGIVYAMPMEGQGFGHPSAGRFQALQVSDHCTIMRSGIGGANAQRAVLALHDAGVDAVLSWGCAAGLHPDMEPGALLVPASVIDVDGENIDVDPQLHARICQRLIGPAALRVESLFSSDAPVVSQQQKAELYARYGAIGVDMESAAIALAARSCGLRFAAVRVILDPASQALPEAVVAGMEDDGSFAIGRCLQCLLKRPSDLIAMIGLALNSRRANQALQRVAASLTSEGL